MDVHGVACGDFKSVMKGSTLAKNLNCEKEFDKAAQKNIKVIGVEFPLNPNYKNDDMYGKYGLRNSDAPEIVERLIGLSQKYSNFMFFDQHKMGEHDYLEGVSYDDDHLCRDGAKKMTLRLDSLLKTLD